MAKKTVAHLLVDTLEIAMQTALSRRGVSVIVMPGDIRGIIKQKSNVV